MESNRLASSANCTRMSFPAKIPSKYDHFLWIVTQRKWSYLEGIFAGKDIRVQLAEEAKRFDSIDKTFRTIMAEALKKPMVKFNCLIPNRLNDFKSLINGLDRCQKSLNEYLEAKRNAFARFYFISD